MRNFLQRRILRDAQRRALVATSPIAVSAIGLVIFCSVAVTRATGQATQAGDPAAWRPIWDKMMPVFTSPRCLNCHGGTNPFTGVNHNNGLAVDGSSGNNHVCTECHSAHWLADGSLSWRLSVTAYSGFAPDFTQGGAAVPPVPKEAAEICQTIINRIKEKGQGTGVLITHVHQDPLIGLAFAGRRANAIPDTDHAEPPPMQHKAFEDLVRSWVTDAAASCDLNGTITITETLTGSRTLWDPLESTCRHASLSIL